MLNTSPLFVSSQTTKSFEIVSGDTDNGKVSNRVKLVNFHCK